MYYTNSNMLLKDDVLSVLNVLSDIIHPVP